jgi:hypothetical protein
VRFGAVRRGAVWRGAVRFGAVWRGAVVSKIF